MNQSLSKFQVLLCELFQFDCADLDFGIYRIMNHKREVVEKFIMETLPKAIADELDRAALAAQSQAVKELEAAMKKVLEGLGEDALDGEGNLIEKYRDTKAGKEYLAARAKSSGSHSRDALEASAYNQLYAFFSRYYQDGDFISKRRYSKRERYAIPYNGEEVYLYWANHDQYYVKTAEYFTDYAFTSPGGVNVHFKLKAADIEQNNVKGEKRFFIPRQAEIAWDEAARNLVVPFEYRPLTEQEKIYCGQKNQQEGIIAKALEEIPKRLSPKTAGPALAALTAERRKTSDGESVTYLEHHLRQYTRRNTSDFFIHKDLKGFLSRELDFYLKNEVLNLDEMEASGEDRAEGWFQMMRLIKAIGGRIIEFLHQIEEFQKMLWEKRKFITETGYCITVGNIDEGFYPEIAGCDAQWDEWKALFHIDEEKSDLFTAGKSLKDKRIAFLKSHPTLVLDTKHFDGDFVDRLFGRFDDLDEMTDGLLIRSENWQALNLLTESYHHGIQCIHVDPPYNTQTSGFLYKNDYQHSSWLAMIENRVRTCLPMLASGAAFLCHIDENECERLQLLFANMGLPDAGTVVWDKKNPMLGRKGVATQHEYVLWRTFLDSPIYLQSANVRKILEKAKSLIQKYGKVNERVRREFAAWISNCEGLSGGERAYRLIDDDGRVFQSVGMAAPEPRTDPKFFLPLIHPVTKKKCPVPDNGWSRAPDTLQELLEKGEIVFGDDESVQPRRKVFLREESRRQLASVISEASRGKQDLEKLGLEFPYCHPVSFDEKLQGASMKKTDDIVFDYFAGSGTTGHAVINLNREDGGRRKFILVEMADYFDTVLLPRIKKVTFTPEWKDGKPKRMATREEAERSPRILKYFRLESYEDALNNIAFDDASGQQAMKFDDYFLQYMLKWESRASETLLSVEKLALPFQYKLRIHADGQTREQVVDIPETFNYLLGLHVLTRRVFKNGERRYLVYRGRINHRDGADEVFVNGDSLIPNARALDPMFKARMFAGVEG